MFKYIQVKEQLNAIEERRLEDMERTERQNSEAQKKLEQILNRQVDLISGFDDYDKFQMRCFRALSDGRSTGSLKSESNSYGSKGRKRDRRH